MTTFSNSERLVIFDADGTTVDAFHAIEKAFMRHGMDIGDIDRFQKRRKLFKFIGGLREFPTNLKRQFGKQSRRQLRETLTEVYRHEATLYPGIEQLLKTLIAMPDVRVGLVTRNVTIEPATTLKMLFHRHGIETSDMDYFACIPLKDEKTNYLRFARQAFRINPAAAYACGDEYKDYASAIGAGMHPFVVSYGFEDRNRLHKKFEIPDDVISDTPQEFANRLLHALQIRSANMQGISHIKIA